MPTDTPFPLAQLHLGADSGHITVRDGRGSRQIGLLLGTHHLAQRHFPQGLPSPLAVERAIAEIEDVVMPLRAQLPPGLHWSSTDPALHALARLAGAPDGAHARLGLDALEALFNRWVARVEGRPATQDTLPSDADFAATLLVLRECMHHLPMAELTVARPEGRD